MFGKLVGAGQAGFVFEKASNPDHYYKVVALGDQPLAEYGLNSTKAKMYAVNRNQARLFYQLSKKDLDISELPEIYSFYTGTVVPKLRQNFLRNNEVENPNLSKLLSALPVGQKIAVWEMEKIPCLNENEYCNQYQQLPPSQNESYQNLLSELLNLGFVVRDIANPENFGYREDGTQVFFDPIVADWPTYEADKFLQPVRYDSFVASFGKDQLETVARSIRNGDYFTWYHGGGVMEAEDVKFLAVETVDVDYLDTKKLYQDWLKGVDWNPTINPAVFQTVNWFNQDFEAITVRSADEFWKLYFEKFEYIIESLMEETLDGDGESIGHIEGWYGALTPTNMVWCTYETLQEIEYEQYNDEVDELLIIDTTNITPASVIYPPYAVFCEARDDNFSRLIKSISFSLMCQNCMGSGTKSDDRDNEYYCDECDGSGKHESDSSWNDWIVKRRKERK